MFRVKRVALLGSLLFFCLGSGALTGSALANEEKDYKNLEIFTDVLSLVRSSYVEEVDMNDLIYGAIRGMLNTLDPHSSFLTPDMYEDMQADTHGEFGGLGIEITVKDRALIVVTPIEDTPAYKAGIKAGDQIIMIDGQPTQEMEVMQAVRLLRGPKGEAITLTIQRSGLKEPQAFTIVRDIIQLRSVKSNLLDGHFGYVRVSQFQDRTGTDLTEQLEQLRAESSDGLQGMILDLRNNPGGLLEQAVAVSDLFLQEGLIVYTEGREPDAQLKFSARSEGTEPEYPLVLLINGGSASAAEIVAGALQDHDRAIILGEQSFGKGSVQTIIPLNDDSGLRLTTARYFTPSGRSIQARGITPDIVIPQLTMQRQDLKGLPIREQDLENHFRPPADSKPNDQEKNATEGLTNEEKEDYQLMRALDLLKGIEILKRGKQAA